MLHPGGTPEGIASHNPDDIEPWLRRRYADLIAAGWPPDLVAEHRGLLRHAVRCDIPPGYYAVRSAVFNPADPGKLVGYRLAVPANDGRLAEYRAVFRYDDALLAPRRAVPGILARIGETGADLAAARFRRWVRCRRCGGRLTAAEYGGSCSRCVERLRQATVARRAARVANHPRHLTLIQGGRS